MIDNDIPLDQIFIRQYTRIVGIAILYYDYLVTFDDEVQYIWRYKGSSLWLFYINRYFSLVAIIPELAISFPSILGTDEACHQFTAYSQIIIVVAQLIVSVVLLLRTFALYDRSWRILGLMLSVGIPLVGFIIWSIAIQETGLSSIYMGCTVAGTPKSQFYLSIAWMALILFDILIFLLTIMKTYQERRTCHSAILGRMGSLIDLIYKDGAIYFGIMASVNIANTITFYTLPPALQACLSRLASSISVSLITRLILNLRKQAFTRTIETGLDPRMSLNFSDVCVNPEIEMPVNHPCEKAALEAKAPLMVISGLNEDSRNEARWSSWIGLCWIVIFAHSIVPASEGWAKLGRMSGRVVRRITVLSDGCWCFLLAEGPPWMHPVSLIYENSSCRLPYFSCAICLVAVHPMLL
ncbi:hypothetical protein ABKN59_009105 [Abortiporus biennis]